MNILLITPEYPPYGSGIANVVYTIQNHLLKKGIHVSVLSQKGADITVSNPFISLPGLASLIPFWQKAVNYASKVKGYDVIWLHSPLLVNAKKLHYLKKVIITFHSTYRGFYKACREYALNIFLPYYLLATKLENHFLKQLSSNKNIIVTAVSPSVANELRENGLTLYPYLIPNGVNTLSHMMLDKYQARKLLQRRYNLQLSEESMLLLYVGRITEIKQPLLLINLFKKLSYVCSDLNLHLIIIGSGTLLKKLKEKSYDQNNIHILGYVRHNELYVPFSAADVFISLSCYEGNPLAVIEAMSFNLPLILSDIPAHNWIISSNVGYGILVNLHRLNLIKMCNFLREIKEKKIRINKLFLKQFTWENIIERYLNLLNDF